MFLLLVTCIGVNGQLSNGDIPPAGDLDPFGKSISKNNPVNRNDVNSRVVKNFVRSYKNVAGEQWYKLKDGFVSMFGLDEIDYQVAYDKKGSWLHTIRSYSENKLPEDIRHIVKSIYYDCGITLVQEIQKPTDPTTYIVQLTGKTYIVSLRVCDGEMTVLKKYSRSE